MKKMGCLLSILCIFLVSGALAADGKRGVHTTITTKEGRLIVGELIAVKDHSIQILMATTKTDRSYDTSNIRSISVRVAKKRTSAAIKVVTTLLGGGVGGYIGYRVAWRTSQGIAPGVVLGGLAGYAMGRLIGTVAKDTDTYVLDGESPERIEAILSRLRPLARVSDSR